MAAFLVMVIALGYGVSWYLGNPAILYVAVIFALVMNVGSYWYSDKIVLRMTGAKPVSHQEAPELYNIVGFARSDNCPHISRISYLIKNDNA